MKPVTLRLYSWLMHSGVGGGRGFRRTDKEMKRGCVLLTRRYKASPLSEFGSW